VVGAPRRSGAGASMGSGPAQYAQR
jgi:hypothetical protein